MAILFPKASLFPLLFIAFFATAAHAANFLIKNNCPQTLWAAAVPGGGRQLNPGEQWSLDVPAGTTGGRGNVLASSRLAHHKSLHLRSRTSAQRDITVSILCLYRSTSPSPAGLHSTLAVAGLPQPRPKARCLDDVGWLDPLCGSAPPRLRPGPQICSASAAPRLHRPTDAVSPTRRVLRPARPACFRCSAVQTSSPPLGLRFSPYGETPIRLRQSLQPGSPQIRHSTSRLRGAHLPRSALRLSLIVGIERPHFKIWLEATQFPGPALARTKCSFDGSGRGKCETGDCGGLLQCKAYGAPPNTLAEYGLNKFNNLDFFDISLVDGFNVKMDFSPTSGGCKRGIKCTADINGQCPSKLRTSGGCNNPCTVYKTDNYCCNSGHCGPTELSRFFKTRCPDAYSYPKDDNTSTFTCPGGTNYRVVFCP